MRAARAGGRATLGRALCWAAMLVGATPMPIIAGNLPGARPGSPGGVEPAPGPTARGTPRLTPLRFVLPRAAITSAGVYNDQGQLVRTLWRAEALPRGEQLKSWDERDDGGRLVAQGRYDIKLVHHRLSYVWEGVIGNSSFGTGGLEVHKAFGPPTDIVIEGNRAYYAVGYNEAQPGLHGFFLAAPQVDLRTFASTDPFVSYSMIATDGVRLFWANTGGLSRTSFVGAFELHSARPVAFAAGQAVCLNPRPNTSQCYEAQDYRGIADLQTDASEAPTGLAVQRRGRVLAVAHGAQNLIRLFDKSSGELIHTLSVPMAPKALNQLAMTPDGDLWVISGKTVLRYTDLERTPTIAATLAGLEQPLALATGPTDDDAIWVADGGPSQQVKRFDRRGRAGAVIGRRGGYANDPLVAPDKLCFRGPAGREQAAIAVSALAVLWVTDHCNNRMLRFRTDDQPSPQSDEQVAYLPAFYASTVDHGNPRRVFANFLEFEVDTDAPLVAGRSWKLVRNWLVGLPDSLVDDRAFNGAFGGFTAVETLSNGRTYGMLTARGRQVVVELPASGPLREVKVLAPAMPYETPKVLYENGDLGFALTGSRMQTAMRLALSGFDNAHNPVWSAEPLALAAVPALPGSPYYRGAFSGMPPRFPVTSSGKVVFFDQSVTGNEGFHLGAARLGDKQWLWQASPSGPLDGKGSFQTRAIDRSLTYGGNAVWASGRHIVYGYHGEFYKDLQTGRTGQANQFMDFDESGLFLGQFGQASTRAASASQAGLSGNAFSPTLVHDGPHLYLYHNDESSHGGVHRWRIDGWNDVIEMNGSGNIGDTIVLH